jgi:hypothetical protein
MEGEQIPLCTELRPSMETPKAAMGVSGIPPISAGQVTAKCLALVTWRRAEKGSAKSVHVFWAENKQGVIQCADIF